MRWSAATGVFAMRASGADSLELRDPADAFRRIEEWLRERGFFEPGGGGEGPTADLFLSYGLVGLDPSDVGSGASRAVPRLAARGLLRPVATVSCCRI